MNAARIAPPPPSPLLTLPDGSQLLPAAAPPPTLPLLRRARARLVLSAVLVAPVEVTS